MELGELIRSKRLVQIRDKEFGFKENFTLHIDFIDYYDKIVQEYHNSGQDSAHSSWNASLNYFKAFAGSKLLSNLLTEEHEKKYKEFLLKTKNLRTNKAKLSINTASSYYKNFAAVLKRAYQENIIDKDLANKIVFIKEEQTYREYLSEEELVKL